MSAINVIEIPDHVAGHNQIQASVVVVIHPGGARGPSGAGDACTSRYIGERPIAVIVIQSAVAIAGNEQVFVAIIVVVAHGNASRVAASGESSLLSHVFKRAVRFLMIESVPVCGAILLGNGTLGHGIVNASAVGKKDVETAVIIIVKHGDAGPHCFEQVFARGLRGFLLEVYAEFVGHIDELARGSLRRGGGSSLRSKPKSKERSRSQAHGKEETDAKHARLPVPNVAHHPASLILS